MTDKEQLAELMKLDGRIPGGMVWLPTHPTEMVAEPEPDYLNSVEMALSLVKKQPKNIRISILHHLIGMVAIKHDDFWQSEDIIAIQDATARQLCEALLRSSRKWKELT